MAATPEISGGMQLAIARRDAGYVVGENVTDDLQLTLLCPSGGMGCSTQAWRLKAMTDYGLGPEVFNRVMGSSGGALVLAAFVAGQQEMAVEMFPHLAQTDFMDMGVVWDRKKRGERSFMRLSLLSSMLSEDPDFMLDTDVVCESNTEFLFTTAHISSLSTNIRSTKRPPKVGPKELIPLLMKGANMPVLGPGAEDGELDGATWNSDILGHWNQAAHEAGQTTEEAAKTHLVVLENSIAAIRPRNLITAPFVARWLRRQSEIGVSAWDVYRQFMSGQAEPTLHAVSAYLTGSFAARAASVQIFRPSTLPPNATSASPDKFWRAGMAAREDILRAIDDPDSVKTFNTAAERPAVRVLARQALARLIDSRRE